MVLSFHFSCQNALLRMSLIVLSFVLRFGCYLFFFFFFFFKQKTAYEIVSRDWSSDVCSSDLSLTECVWGFVRSALWDAH